MDQGELPGMPNKKAAIGPSLRIPLAMEMGGQCELHACAKELRDMQKQHPAVAGLTLALAIVDRRIAESQVKATRQILSFAAKNGMPIEDHAIITRIEGDELMLEAVKQPEIDG